MMRLTRIAVVAGALVVGAWFANAARAQEGGACVNVAEFVDFMRNPPDPFADFDIYGRLRGEAAQKLATVLRYRYASLVGAVYAGYSESRGAGRVLLTLADDDGCLLYLDGRPTSSPKRTASMVIPAATFWQRVQDAGVAGDWEQIRSLPGVGEVPGTDS